MTAVEDASWAASVQRYEYEKKVSPVLQEKHVTHRQYRDGRFCQKDKQREYDPLTHKWRDYGREITEIDREIARDTLAMETAKARAIRYESHYDVVTNHKKIDVPDEPEPKPSYEPAPEIPQKPREADYRGRSQYYWPTAEKEFHIINNRYLGDHEGRTAVDKQAIMENASKRFSGNNHYNIVQGKLYDSMEEEKFQQARTQAASMHGASKIQRQPLAIKTREGALYDIIAPQSVLNREQLAEYERRKHAERTGTGLKVSYEADLMQRSAQAMALKDERGINRISHERYQATVQRGYNILTNQDFKGRLGKAHPPPRTQPQRPHPLRNTGKLSMTGGSGSYGQSEEYMGTGEYDFEQNGDWNGADGNGGGM